MDVSWLRREIFADGRATAEQAEELFSVERAGIATAREWTELFVDLLTDHVVWRANPKGFVSEARAEWLLAQADSCRTANALAALGNVLAEADRTPPWFVMAVRQRIKAGWRGVDAALRTAAAV